MCDALAEILSRGAFRRAIRESGRNCSMSVCAFLLLKISMLRVLACVCVCVLAHARAYVRVHACVCAYTCVHMYVCLLVYVCMCMCVCVCVGAFLCISACVYIHVCVRVCVPALVRALVLKSGSSFTPHSWWFCGYHSFFTVLPPMQTTLYQECHPLLILS